MAFKILSNERNQVVAVQTEDGKGADAETTRKVMVAQARKEWDACSSKADVVAWLQRFRMTGYGSLVKDIMLPSERRIEALDVTELPSEG